MIRFIQVFAFVIILTSFASAEMNNYTHHDLKVEIDPAKHFVKVENTVTFAEVPEDLSFYLHGNLTITKDTENIKIQEVKHDEKSSIPLKKYEVSLREGDESKQFTICYEGKIFHPVEQLNEEYERGFSTSPGVISEEGIFLSGSSAWIPWFNDSLLTFNLASKLPEGWSMLSQGEYSETTENNAKVEHWSNKEPMDEVYFIGAKFIKYKITTGDVDILAYLRTPDKNLANKYLETTKQYLDMYEKLLGDYPYSKFALVENFWETGYGMPSFTLLGSQIIRFPFILHSSYPHELLHNWWGNSVYVDYASGNWCEGLTAYLADHLIREQHGQGADYRRTTLQGFTDYVNEANDFPLKEFRSRYNASSAAIGYGKSLFLYHMLRVQVGDKAFAKAMQKFYADNKFMNASFDDIRKAFEEVTGKDFKAYFKQWINRKGSPELGLENIDQSTNDGKNNISLELKQYQKEDPYELYIPLRFYLEGENEAVEKFVTMTERTQKFDFSFDKPVLRVDVDPDFDVFRKLHFKEIPPSLSKVFGSEKVMIVLPSQAPIELLEGYKTLAEAWAKDRSASMEIKMDNELEYFPVNSAVWLFGWENQFRNIVSDAIKTYDAYAENDSFFVEGKEFDSDNHSLLVSARNPINPKQVVVLMSTDNAAALPGLGRKLPHYGKYSYLGFEGEEPTNILKGQWVETQTPLSVLLSPDKMDEIQQIKTPARNALAYLPPSFLKENMLETVKTLASDDYKGREIGTEGIKKAGQYIADKFKEYGLKPRGDADSYFQNWKHKINETDEIEMQNVIAVIPGTKKEWASQSVILCAHYDHLGTGEKLRNADNKGKIHPGADDNASGVAVMLEVARKLSETTPERTIIFIAFTGEEYGRLGSIHYLESLTEAKLKGIFGVVNLDTVGRLSDKKLMVLGSLTAREWKFIFMGIEYTSGISTEMLTQDIDSSDHVSFIKAGIPAIQLFTGAHEDYHKPTDTLDKIDGEGLVKIAAVTNEIIVYLSQRPDPMNVQIENNKDESVRPTTNRKVGTGIMPDFRFDGKGVKVGNVTNDSPADKAGLQVGDIIIKVGDAAIEDLKQYTEVLKGYKPGDEVTMEFTRNGETMKVKITFKAR